LNEGRSRWVDAGFRPAYGGQAADKSRLRRTILASPPKSCEDKFELLKPGRNRVEFIRRSPNGEGGLGDKRNNNYGLMKNRWISLSVSGFYCFARYSSNVGKYSGTMPVISLILSQTSGLASILIRVGFIFLSVIAFLKSHRR